MLKLAAEKGVKPWIELVEMKDCSKAIERVSKGDSTYSVTDDADVSPLPLRPQAGHRVSVLARAGRTLVPTVRARTAPITRIASMALDVAATEGIC